MTPDRFQTILLDHQRLQDCIDHPGWHRKSNDLSTGRFLALCMVVGAAIFSAAAWAIQGVR